MTKHHCIPARFRPSRSGTGSRTGPRAFGLVELTVTVVLVALLCGGAVLYYRDISMASQLSTAQIELARIRDEIHRWVLVPGRTVPARVADLKRMDEGGHHDPWGEAYVIQKDRHRIVSSGPNRTLETGEVDPKAGGDDLAIEFRPPVKDSGVVWLGEEPSITKPLSYKNQVIRVTAPLTIGPGGALELERCEIKLDPKFEGEVMLTVSADGRLVLERTTLRGTSWKRWGLRADGTARVEARHTFATGHAGLRFFIRSRLEANGSRLGEVMAYDGAALALESSDAVVGVGLSGSRTIDVPPELQAAYDPAWRAIGRVTLSLEVPTLGEYVAAIELRESYLRAFKVDALAGADVEIRGPVPVIASLHAIGARGEPQSSLSTTVVALGPGGSRVRASPGPILASELHLAGDSRLRLPLLSRVSAVALADTAAVTLTNGRFGPGPVVGHDRSAAELSCLQLMGDEVPARVQDATLDALGQDPPAAASSLTLHGESLAILKRVDLGESRADVAPTARIERADHCDN
jgi:hypothetical protein